MPTEKLTARRVETLQSGGKRVEIFDAALPGFGIRVSETGAKSWVLLYRQNGVKRRLTLGTYPALSLLDGRQRAREAMEQIDKGRDPGAEKARRRRGDGHTFGDAVSKFMKLHASKNRSAAHTQRIFDVYVLPQWNRRLTSDITRRDVKTLIDDTLEERTELVARSVFAQLRKLFNWCVDQLIIEVSPVLGLKAPGKPKARDRLLTDAEIRAFWQACEEDGSIFGDAFRLLLCTGQRRSEVFGLDATELALSDASWTMTGDRTKNGNPHLVALCPVAVDIMRGCLPKDGRNGGLLFPADGHPDRPASGISKAKARIDAAMLVLLRKDNAEATLPPWRLHDLRRTFASGCRRAGVALDVVEKMLNHTSGSFGGIVGVYQLHSYEKEKREAAAAWGLLLEEIITGGKQSLHAAGRR